MKKLSGLKIFSALFIIVSMLAILSPTIDTKAFSGRDPWRGYFYNQLDYYGPDVFQGGITISGGTQRALVDDFINTLYWRHSRGGRDRAGAAFIYHTMVGHGPGQSVDNVDFENLRNRLYAMVDGGGWIAHEPSRYIYGQRNTYMQNNYNDVAWFTETGITYTEAYVFYSANGTPLYVIKRDCANPLGALGGIPDVSRWYINGQSYVKKNATNATRYQGMNAVTARPGEMIYWDHDLRNTGPDDMERDVTINIDRQDRSIETGEQLSFNSNPAGDRGRGRVGQLFYVNKNINHTVGQGDVGKKLCQLVSWRDGAWDDSNWYDSEYACVNVPYNYSLTPTITDNLLESIPEGENTVEVGATIPTVNNGGPTKSKNAKDAVVRFVVRNDDTKTLPAGEGITKGGSNWACDVAQEIGIRNSVSVDNTGTCKVLAGSSDEVLFPPNGKVFTLGDDDISDLDSLAIGDRICYVTMVSAYDQNTSIDTFRYSQSVCVRIAKKPKVQVWGSDVRVGDTGDTGTGNIKTSNTRRNGKLYGSWVEYDMSASGSIVSASGAGLSGSDGRPLDASYNALTFANTPPEFGHFGVMPRTTLAPEYNNMDGIPSDVTLGEGDIPAVVKTAGTVTITQDIISDDATEHTTIAGLPQHIIIAKNIIIQPEVTRVDAWLISQSEDGYISTCGAVGEMTNPFAGLTASICDRQLRITGPVIAEHLFLRRTAGSGRDDPGAPAEIINIRPDTYLWAYSKSMEISPIKTMYVRELPPRF